MNVHRILHNTDHSINERPSQSPVAHSCISSGHRGLDPRFRHLVFQHERDFHVHSVGLNLAVFDIDSLILDPCTCHVLKGFAGSTDSHFDGVSEALL